MSPQRYSPTIPTALTPTALTPTITNTATTTSGNGTSNGTTVGVMSHETGQKVRIHVHVYYTCKYKIPCFSAL